MAGSGQNFQQMPHLMHLPRSTSGRMFPPGPGQIVGLVADRADHEGISSADLKTIFLAFLGLMASFLRPSRRLPGPP